MEPRLSSPYPVTIPTELLCRLFENRVRCNIAVPVFVGLEVLTAVTMVSALYCRAAISVRILDGLAVYLNTFMFFIAATNFYF
jgi:hypothetical protein